MALTIGTTREEGTYKPKAVGISAPTPAAAPRRTTTTTQSKASSSSTKSGSGNSNSSDTSQSSKSLLSDDNKFSYDDRDYNSLIDTVIGEALGLSPKAQTAVAYTVKNRALTRGQSPYEVVSAKGQYNGYTDPGWATEAARKDPAVRSQIGEIVKAVLDGDVPDPTIGPDNQVGADFFHGKGVTPKWAGEFTQVANFDDHTFYSSGATPKPQKTPVPAAAPNRALGITPDSVDAIANRANAVAANLPTATTPEWAKPADPAANPDVLPRINQAGTGFEAQYVAGADPRLVDIINEASAYSPFRVVAKSGYREGDPRFHGQKKAVDITLVDKKTGKPLGGEGGDYQNPETFREYEKFAQVARTIQQKKYPELGDQFRWGGYFSGDIGQDGTYGAVDLMHFDIGGGGKYGMVGGSWDKGLTDAQRAKTPGAVSQGLNGQYLNLAEAVPVPAEKSGSEQGTVLAMAQPQSIEAGAKADVPKSNAIILDDKYKPADGLGLFNGKNPFASAAATPDPAKAAPGMIEAGNIDLSARPVVANADGSISTLKSISVGIDGKEMLIPTIAPDGSQMSEAEAVARYRQTGEHLGIFDTPQNATAFAQALSAQQGDTAIASNNQRVAAAFQQLEQDAPGRYQIIPADKYETWRTDWQATQPGFIEDSVRMLSGGVVTGVGATLRGVGALAAAVANNSPSKMVENIFGLEPGPLPPAENLLDVPASAVDAYGDWIKQGVSWETKQAIADSSPNGDILNPTTWTLGKAPSLRGYTALALDVLGSMAPVVAAGMVSGGVGAAATGGFQGAGAAAQQAGQIIDQMAAQPGVLEKESAYYRQLLASGLSQEEAQKRTKFAAEQMAAIMTAPVSAFGGYATSKILDPATKILAGRSMVVRMLGRTGLSAAEEGSQEAAETYATMSGVNQAAGTSLDTTQGTFGDFLLGALGGAPAGTVSGAFSRAEGGASAAPETPAMTDVPPAATQPPTVTAMAGSAAPTAPAEPVGPIGRARQRAGVDAVAPTPADPVATEPGAVTPDWAQPPVADSTQPADVVSDVQPQGAPPLGATVVVEDGTQSGFAATVDGYADGGVMVFDQNGEMMLVPLDAITSTSDVPLAEPPQNGEFPTGKAIDSTPTDGLPDNLMRNLEPAQVEDYTGTAWGDQPDSVVDPQTGDVMTTVPPGGRATSTSQGDAGSGDQSGSSGASSISSTGTGGSLTQSVATGGGNAQETTFSDRAHADLFNLGRKIQSARYNSRLKMPTIERLLADDIKTVADSFGISEQSAVEIADDYRYRVMKALKASDKPITAQNVNPQLLESARQQKAAGTAPQVAPDQYYDPSYDALKTEDEVRRVARAEADQSHYPDQADAIAEAYVQRWRENHQTTDGAANAAATSPTNAVPQPSEAQIKAGNYQKGHVSLGGTDISIENPAGSTRSGTDPNGKAWSVTMKSHYGYFRGTVGKDKDHVDTFIKPGTEAIQDGDPVWVVDQKKANGHFDEHKVMLGYKSGKEARQAYMANYARGWTGLGALNKTTMGGLKDWFKSGDTTQPFASNTAPQSEESVRRAARAKADQSNYPDHADAIAEAEVERFRDKQIRHTRRQALEKGVAQMLDRSGERKALEKLAKDGASNKALMDHYRERIGKHVLGSGEDGISFQARPAGLSVRYADETGKIVETVFKGKDLVDAIRAEATTAEASGEADTGAYKAEVQYGDDAIFPKPEKTLAAEPRNAPFISQDEADARLQRWKDIAKQIGREQDNSKKVIISLFDDTGAWSQPYVDAGYEVMRFDLAHGDDIFENFPSGDIIEYQEKGFSVVGVLSACPCTTFAASGARWWESRHNVANRDMVEKLFGPRAARSFDTPVEANAWMVHMTGAVVDLANPQFHVLENPIGRIGEMSGLPAPLLRFDPHNFGNPYTKRTQLWGDFNPDLPTANVEPVEGSKVQSKLRGDNPEDKRARSETPEGFAYAFFMANDPDARRMLARDEKGAAATPPARQTSTQPVPEPVSVRIGDRTHPFTSYEDASKAYRKTVEATGTTGGGETGPKAPNADFLDANGNVVAYMSYNGRVWAGRREDYKAGAKPLYDAWKEPPAGSALEAPVIEAETRKTPQPLQVIDGDAFRARLKTNGDDMRRASAELVSELQTALDDGRLVTLFADSKPIAITRIANGMMQDAQGQRWGTMSLATDNGLGNRIEISDQRSGAKKPFEKTSVQKESGRVFSKNKIFTEDRVAAARARMKAKFNQLNSGIDPELLVDGMTIAGAYIESGVRNFADYAKAMVNDLGEGVKPYLLSFWEAARNYPGLDTEGMTDTEDAAAAFKALMTAEPPTEAGAVLGAEAKKPKSRSRKTGKPADMRLTQDWGVDHIDAYDTEDEGTGDGVKDKFLKEAQKYLRATASLLTEEGVAPVTDARGRPEKAVFRNDAGIAVSGDVTLHMFDPVSGKYVYAQVGEASLRGMVPMTQSGIAILTRTGKHSYGVRDTNVWAPVTLTPRELSAMLLKAARRGLTSDDIARAATENRDGDAAKLDRSGPDALENLPAEAVRQPSEVGQAGRSPARGSEPDLFGSQPARGERDGSRDGLADGQREVPVSARQPGDGRSLPRGQRATERDGAGAGGTEPRAAGPGRSELRDSRPTGDVANARHSDPEASRTVGRRDVGPEPEEATAASRSERSGTRGALEGDAGSDDRGNSGKGPEPGQTERPVRRVDTPATPAGALASDYAISDADELGAGGAKAKFRNNVAAIELLRTLEAEKRPATRQEQAVLAKWVGWGGLRGAFRREDGSVAKGWDSEVTALEKLLSADEMRAAVSSTRNAHYTSTEIVNGLWRAVEQFGFSGGKMLEPSVGAGNFIGLMPAGLRKAAQITGVELDHITGGIAKNLYPGATILAPRGFETVSVPDGYFDLAIGNPPFGSERLYDPERRGLNKFSIHNFFFAKSIDTLKPNGVLAMVVTNYFLDSTDSAARNYISDRADLIGAIRLPNTAFLANAGTEVTTDLVFLKKRPDGQAPANTRWTQTIGWTDAEGRTMPLNAYFKANPDMMLGKFGAYGTMYGPDMPALVAREGDDIAALLDRAIKSLPANIMERPAPVIVEATAVAPKSAGEAEIGSAFIEDGKIYRRLPDLVGEVRSEPVTFPNEKAEARVSGLIHVRDAFTKLRAAQLSEDASDEKIANLRGLLNKAYDGFVRKNGPINADANKRLFRDDPTWPQISALEDNFDKGVSKTVAARTGETPRAPSADKAAIFTKRTQRPYAPPDEAKTAKDALTISLAQYGRIDMARMSALYGKSPAQIIKELGDLVFTEPDGTLVTAEEYLSGNVKAKLAQARDAAKNDAAFKHNVSALESVIPADIEPVDITVKPGAHWVAPHYVEQFLEHVTEMSGAKATFSRLAAKWTLAGIKVSSAAEARWTTERANLSQLLDATINDRTMQIYDRIDRDKTELNVAATEAANQKVQALKDEWQRWIWDDDARREDLSRVYNDTFNTDVLRQHDGSHLVLPGKVSDDVIELRPNQKNFVWRTLTDGTALADHVVGAGKTFAIVASIMEKRRIGQANKPAVTVPNHLVGQWAADFIKLYPGAKVLAPSERDFEKANRKRLFARIATGDWDAVILAHSSFGRIGVSPELEADFIRKQVDDIETSMRELRAQQGKDSRSVAQLAKWRDNLEAKIKKLNDSGAKDDGLTFDELGIDALYVDEAHEFKNLGFATSIQRVAGLGNPTGSQKASDLYMKSRIVMQRTGGKNVVFATGTPISNTMAEMFTMQRYLDEEGLNALGIFAFDAWARTFGEITTSFELSPTGQYKPVTRFAKFTNVPELLTRYRSFADVITNPDIKRQLEELGKKFPLPKIKGGKPILNVVPRSAAQAAFIGEGRENAETGDIDFPEGSLVYRAMHLPKKAEKGSDNMLKIMSDARKAALDMRLIDPAYSDYAGSKTSKAAANIARIWRTWENERGTQLVFIDLSTPNKARAKEKAKIEELVRAAAEGDERAQQVLDGMSPDEIDGLLSAFSVYDDLKRKLVSRGIPEAEVAFIHDANTDEQKQALFAKVRNGNVRVLFGSTPKMGAGTNVQTRIVGLHHLDAPWRPSDLEQRDGRGIRAGNELYAADPENFALEIHRYATEKTLDARMWQTIEAKARFIEQLRKGDVSDRQIEDIAGEAASAAEMKAAASGNPLILEEVDLKERIRRLERARTEHDREQHRMRFRISSLEREKAGLEADLPAMSADATAAQAVLGDPDAIVIDGKSAAKATEIGEAVRLAATQMATGNVFEKTIGQAGSFKVRLERIAEKGFELTLSGRNPHSFGIDMGEDAATTIGMRFRRRLQNAIDGPELAEERIAKIDTELPKLDKLLAPWPDAQELAKAKARHAEVIEALRPKRRQEPETPTETPKPSIFTSTPFGKLRAPTREKGSVALYRGAGQNEIAALRSGTYKPRDGQLGVQMTTDRGTAEYFGEFNKGETLDFDLPRDAKVLDRGTLGKSSSAWNNLLETASKRPEFTIGNQEPAIRNELLAQGYDAVKYFSPKAKYDVYEILDPRNFATPDATSKPSLDLNMKVDGARLEYGPDPAGVEPSDITEMRAILETVAGARNAKILDRLETDDAGSWGIMGASEASGLYYPVSDMIHLSYARADNRVAFHEAFHRLQNLFLTDAERAVLRDDAARLKRMVRSDPGLRDLVDGMDQNEIEAEAFAIYADGRSKVAPHKAVRAVWDRLSDLISRVRNYFAGRGFTSPTSIFAAAASGDIARRSQRRPGRFVENAPRIDTSDLRIRVPSQKDVIERVRGGLTDLKPALLKVIPLNYFPELAQKNMTGVAEYIHLKRKMDAYRGEHHGDADKIAQNWLKIIRSGSGLLPSKEGRSRAAQISAIMHDSTLAGIDPSKPRDFGVDKEAYAQMKARYLALPKAAQDLYRTVRDAYKAQSIELDRILVDNVKRAFEIAQSRADADYEAEVERIERAEMGADEKKRLIDQLTKDHETAKKKAGWGSLARVVKLRQNFEKTRAQEPYFPLARFGRYFVTVRDVDGSVLSFSRRERAADRDRLARDMQQAHPTATIETGVLDNSNEIRQAMDPRFIAEVEAILGPARLDADIMDQIWQRYLETMPDLSARKRFIHRKGTAGYDEDALRAFSSHMFHAAHQMARLKFGQDLNEMTNVVSEQARKAPDPTAGMTLANQLRENHKWVMNPTGSAVAQKMTSTAFVWYLGATPAAALVNMTQTPMLGIPILGARFGGVTKATAALAQASADTVFGKGSVTNSARLTADERAAIESCYETGLIDRTQAHDLAGVGDTGVEYSALRARMMAIVSFMFHRAEVWNREVTALAAYRMARKAGLGHDAAVDAAHDLTWKAHFDYSNASRPKLMQNDFAKVALVFRAHNINMIYRVLRDVHQSIKGDTPQARKEARYQLAGIFAMQALLAGAEGVFAYNAAMALMGMFMGGDDDPFDFKTKVRRDVLDILGPELGGLVLDGVPGHYLGVDLAQRIGMPDIWFRSPTRDLDGRDEFEYYVMNSLGASVSMLGDFKYAFDMVRKGKYGDALEIASPKFARDLLRARNYMEKGLTSRKGDELIPADQMSVWEAIAQSVGFTPAHVTETYERNNALKNAEQRILDARREALNQFALAYNLGDKGLIEAAIGNIRKFNSVPSHKAVAITDDTIERSLTTRARNAAKREDGVLIANEALGKYLRDRLPARVN